VGGRLAHFTQAWHLLTDEEWLRNTIQHGFRILFHTVPPLRPPPPRLHVKVSHQDSRGLETEIFALLKKRAIEETSGPEPQAAERVCTAAAFTHGDDSSVRTPRKGVPLSGPVLWPEIEPFGLDQAHAGCSLLGSVAGHQAVGVLGRIHHPGGELCTPRFPAGTAGTRQPEVFGSACQLGQVASHTQPRDLTFGV
ncbi:hypothetical protein, partial, partial [Parasitella parasitica]